MVNQVAAIEKLCEILIEQNTEIFRMLKKGKFNKKIMMDHAALAVRKIKKIKKMINNEPKAQLKSKREVENENEYEKLIVQINKLKDDRIQQ